MDSLFRVWPQGSTLAGKRPLLVEIGPGRGDFLFSLAGRHPRTQIVGIECKRKRVEKLIARVSRHGLKNIILVEGRAQEAIPVLFRRGSVTRIYINFPDPWPKRRHQRRRLLTHPFLSQLIATLRPRGDLHIVTDHEGYFQEIVALLGASGRHRIRAGRLIGGPLFPRYTETLYEEKKRVEGACFYRITARKI